MTNEKWPSVALLSAAGTPGPRGAIKIDYTNYRGERSVREIAPERLWFGVTEWHPQPQWLLDAFDVEKQKQRSFALRDIHGVSDAHGRTILTPFGLATPQAP